VIKSHLGNPQINQPEPLHEETAVLFRGSLVVGRLKIKIQLGRK
jgi:hypothetical protein